MDSGDEDNYWTGLSLTGATESEAGPSSDLTVQVIDRVEPLDSQFGLVRRLTVPTALHNPLFGQLIKDCATLPLYTYAILDAAKVPCLPEILDASGLDYACLFQGEAEEELRYVAPYLVRLEEEHDFTRNLFTRGEAGWQMWDKEPAIFIRAQVRLHELRKHLRKFTQIRTEAGLVEYFRFWESTVLDYISFFGGADLGWEIFPRTHVLWRTYYYSSGPRFALMRVGNFQ